jgi:hypothetical protein
MTTLKMTVNATVKKGKPPLYTEALPSSWEDVYMTV